MARTRYLPSGVLAKPAAARILRRYQGLLAQSVLHAWDQWSAIGAAAPAARSEMSRSTRASAMNNFMCSEADRLFSPLRNVSVQEDSGQKVFTFANGDLRLTFHKVALTSVPAPQSDRQLDIWSQESATGSITGNRPIPGTGSGTWVECGYVLDSTETRITDIVVRCSTEGTVDWVIDIPMAARRRASSTVAAAVAPAPLVAPAAPAPMIASAKPAAARKKSNAGP